MQKDEIDKLDGWIKSNLGISGATTNSAAALAVMEKHYEQDMNDYFSAFHNFLIRKDHDRSLSPLQICLFAKQRFSK